MLKRSISVYVQLPGDERKSLVGEFTWNDATAVGAFVYDDHYLKLKQHYLLDPVALKPRPNKEVRNNGIYGVLRDAGPDAWGRDQLARAFGRLDEIGVLMQSPEDGAGNISFHPEHRLRAYTLKEIDEASDGFPPSDATVANALHQTTSMGGAKPKLLVHDDGAFWIAKFPEKGDPECKNALNEHAMLAIATECGIDACESRIHILPDGRPILLVKRFDLAGTPQRYTRMGFASAHTVLGMGDPRADDKLKSYPLLRHQMRLWTKSDTGAALWQRLVFNALVNNGDDHARNHALVYNGHCWSLSKAFDIVAAPGAGPVRLCLQIQGGSVMATPENLLLSANEMGVEREQAIATMKAMSATILAQWRDRVGRMSAGAVEQLRSAFRLAEAVSAFDFASVPVIQATRRYRPRQTFLCF